MNTTTFIYHLKMMIIMIFLLAAVHLGGVHFLGSQSHTHPGTSIVRTLKKVKRTRSLEHFCEKIGELKEHFRKNVKEHRTPNF